MELVVLLAATDSVVLSRTIVSRQGEDGHVNVPSSSILGPIDVVYTWVNGSDLYHQERMSHAVTFDSQNV